MPVPPWPRPTVPPVPPSTAPSPPSLLTHPLPQDGASRFSFWAWLDGILGLLQEHLKQLWKDG